MSASITIYEKEHASREKYIYFVCGLAGVLFAYIGKDYFPTHPQDLRDKLTIGAMASLALSLAFGMAHIQFNIKGISLNKDVLVVVEEIGNCVITVGQRKAGQANRSINTKTGKEHTTEEIEATIERLKALNAIQETKMKRWFLGATVLFIICHCFLVSGFILLICSKLIA